MRFFKETEEGVAAMCKVMEDMRNETALAKAKQIAENFIRNTKLSDNEIASNVELPVKEISTLRESLLQTV